MTLTPLCLVYVRAVGRLHRQARHAERMALEMRLQRDDALDLVTDLSGDIEELQARCDGWQRRAEALADVVDPEWVRGIFAVLDSVERLPEVRS